MENMIIDGKMVNLSSLPIEKLKKMLNQLDTQETKLKQEIDTMLEELIER